MNTVPCIIKKKSKSTGHILNSHISLSNFFQNM